MYRVICKVLGFPNMRGTFFRGPYNKDSNILGSISGSPVLGNYHSIDIKPRNYPGAGRFSMHGLREACSPRSAHH